jgi:hypothetical protein
MLSLTAPIFLLWMLSAVASARATGRWLPGVWTATVMAFATGAGYDAIVVLRVNLCRS